MGKQYLAIVISIFIFSCGGNAENPSEKLIEKNIQITEKETIQPIEEENLQKSITATENIEEESEKEHQVTETIVTSKVNEEEKETSEETVGEIIETAEKEFPTAIEIVRPNHEAWNALTKKYVSTSSKVNYKGMKADLSKITTYLEHLKNTSPKNDWSKNEKLAYWINLYNASTVYLIASNYPTSSITKLSGGKPWDKKFVKSGSKTYSLNDIENTIVRPQFKDPRIHAALNCAAVSCPKLLNGAFFSSKLNAQLDKQTRAWINDASKNKLNGSKAQISQIFDWYKVDFKEGVVAFINKYISTGVALEPKAKISYLEYDWALNE